MKILLIGIAALVLLYLQKRLYMRLWDANLNVNVEFAKKLVKVNETGELVQVVENKKRLPLPMLKVKFKTSANLEFASESGSKTTDMYYRNEVFQIGGGGKITRRLKFKAKKRGYYTIKNIDILSTDLFFSKEFIKSLNADTHMYVYPKAFESEELLLSLQNLSGDALVEKHYLEDPFEIRGIREYQPFDDMRSVNWKATAKTNELLVNQKGYTALKSVRIFLNIEDGTTYKKEKDIEAAIEIAMGIASYFLLKNTKVSCYTNARDILTKQLIDIDGGVGAPQENTIQKAFARIDINQESPLFKNLYESKVFDNNDSSLTFFVSPNGFAEFVEMLKKCSEQGMDYTWFYPYSTSEKPKIPPELEKNVKFLHID